MKICQHWQGLKIQKIANFIKKCQIKCKKHDCQEYSLCLHCGEVRCFDNEKQNCSYLHFSTNRHSIVLKLRSHEIFCHICEIPILPIEYNDEQKNKKLIKMIDWNDKIMNYLQKYPPIDKQLHNNKIIIHEVSMKILKIQQKEGKKNKKNQNLLRIFGLINIGNTCFFNSILQCLYATNELHEMFREIQYQKTLEEIDKYDKYIYKHIYNDISIIFRKFLKNTEKTYCPKNLFQNICKIKGTFRTMQQQDAQQMLGTLLNCLIDNEKKNLKIQKQNDKKLQQCNKNSLKIGHIQKIFGFFLVSRLFCLNCQKTSWNLDFTLDLNVEIIKNINNIKKIQFPQGLNISKQQIGYQGLKYPIIQQDILNTIIDPFFTPEILTKKNYYKCQKCQFSKAIRKFYIKDPPEILIIVLKRFNNNGSKNNTSIKLQQKLNLNNYTLNFKQDVNYIIYGLVVHNGTTKGGHYISYTRRFDDWYYFSDSHHKMVSWDKVKLSNPYIIFYQRTHIN